MGYPSVVIITLCLVMTSVDCINVVFPSKVTEGGSLITFPGSNIYGNNVTLRQTTLPSGNLKSWLDFEHILPTGILDTFYIYIHNLTIIDGYTDIRLQIWRPTIQAHQYLLVWERQVTVQLNHNAGALYEIKLEKADQFQVQHGDRLGWTNEGAISFDYVEGHRTYFRNMVLEFPNVGELYLFDNIHLPTIFSVAAQINSNTGCDDRYWGDDCKTLCHCAEDADCSTYGYCSNGCENGWIGYPGQRCDVTACPSAGMFGPNCTEVCHCRAGLGCRQSDGYCYTGCAAGWTGLACNYKSCDNNNGDCGPDAVCQYNDSRTLCECRAGLTKDPATDQCIDACIASYKVISASKMLRPVCTTIQILADASKLNCLNTACRVGANTLGISGDICELWQCLNLNNLVQATYVWDIYIRGNFTEEDTSIVTSTTKQSTVTKVPVLESWVIPVVATVSCAFVILVVIVIVVVVVRRRKSDDSNYYNSTDAAQIVVPSAVYNNGGGSVQVESSISEPSLYQTVDYVEPNKINVSNYEIPDRTINDTEQANKVYAVLYDNK